MTKRLIGIFLRPFTLLALILSFGCAQQMKSVQAEPAHEISSTAQIQSIIVADDAARVEIISDKAIVYTYYMLESPPRVIVDLAQTAPGSQPFPMDVNKGAIKRIDVARHEFGSGVLSRIDIALNGKTEISASLDQQNKRKLVLSIPVPLPVQVDSVPKESPAAAPAAAVVVAAPVVETVQIVEPTPIVADNQGAETTEPASQDAAKTEPVKEGPAKAESAGAVPSTPVLLTGAVKSPLKPGERALTAIKKVDDGLVLELSAEPDSFKIFRLAQPERLVMDIPKTKSAIATKIIDINAFNLGKARIGTAQDKLRIVFDAVGGIPPYSIVKSSSGLLIAFGESAKKKGTEKQDSETGNLELVKAEKAGSRAFAAEAAPVAATAPLVPVAAPRSPATQVIAVPVETSPVTPPAPVKEESVHVPVPVATPVVKKPLAGSVETIEFTQADGFSRITIRTSGNCVADEPVKKAKGFSLTLKGCRLPVKLQRQLDTSGFESAIKSVAPFSVKRGVTPETRIAVNLRSVLTNTLTKDGDVFYWEFKEPAKVVKPARPVKVPKAAASAPNVMQNIAFDKDIPETRQEQEKSRSDKAMEEAFVLEKVSQPVTRQGKVYNGRKVTLEFSDADIRKIFQLLAEVSNQNILVSDDVSGTISLKLVNVPWDQALDVILENKGLGMQKDGNIVQIRPKTKMKSLDDEAIEMRFTEEKKMPLSTVIFDINFATLAGIETQFKNLKSKRNDASISSDMRTNKLIVVDIEPNINKMRKLLDQLDIPEKQVMIEARIVEASSTFARDIGVKWNFGYQDGSASIANINNLTGTMGGVVTSGLSGSTGGITTGISFGKLLSNIQLDMRLSASSSIGQIKIISTPKVMTVNNKPAKISQGQMIPYQNTSSTDGAKTEFIEAALSLEVTPHITADGSVNMKIKASNNTPGVGSPPPINKKEATTELVVRNGETTVIGGIYVDSENEGDTGVPYLSDIPLLGWMFKSNSKSKSKNEMLIFITPRIIY